MAARLCSMASRITGRNGVVNRSFTSSSLRHRADTSLPVGKHTVPDVRPISVNDELVRDNGTQPRIERIADTVGKYLTLVYLSGGLTSLFGWAYWPGATSPPGFWLP